MSKIISKGVPCQDGYSPSKSRGCQPKGEKGGSTPTSGYTPAIKNESQGNPKPPKSQ